MKTSELLEDIKDIVLLLPSAEYYLKKYLKNLDREIIENDLEDNIEDEEDE